MNAPALHAQQAPSSAERWVPCGGSIDLEAQFPETEDSPDAAAGIAAAWALAEILRGRVVAYGQVADNNETLDDKMVAGAEMAADYVLETAGSSAVELHVEESFVVSPVNRGRPDVWFTLHDATTGMLTVHVFEYKHGCRYVDVYRNWQLVNNALGVLHTLGIGREAYSRVRFVLHVIQPHNFHRDGPRRRWDVSATALIPMFDRILAPRGTDCNPGTWCTDCRGRHACEANIRSAYALYHHSSTSVPLVLPPEALGAELKRCNRAIELLKARASGLEQAAEHLIKGGQRVPGFDLARSAGKEVWNKPDDHVIAYGALLGVDVAKRRAALTPAQARKAGLPDERVKTMTVRVPGALALVEDDGRPIAAFGAK